LHQPADFRAKVIVHELLHLKVPNHNLLFKALLKAYSSVHRRRNLSKRDFKRVPVVLPPLPEQHAIADALCTVQQAKEATEQVIDAVGELKKSLMRYLFMYGPVPVSETGKVLLRDTQAGSVPEHWTVMALGQVVESSFSGGTPSTKVADYWNGDIPWITSAAIAEEDVILQKHQRFITDLGLSKSAAKMAPKDAVIVGTRVGIGKAVVAPSSVAMNQDLTALVLDTRRVEPTFLAYLFKTDAIQRSMQLLARGTTIKGVPRNDLLDLLIPLPPLNKQHAITRILRLVDGRLVAERNKKQALDALFNTLLLNLMEGKVRLPEFAGGE
jgi:type I restriction enzyme S subunit